MLTHGGSASVLSRFAYQAAQKIFRRAWPRATEVPSYWFAFLGRRRAFPKKRTVEHAGQCESLCGGGPL